MSDETDTASSAATRDDAKTKDNKDLVKLWLSALELADHEEKNWRERAQETINIYRNTDRLTGEVMPATRELGSRRFNILHSNVETILPAIYNSTPIPDVRRRFADDDKLGKEVADLIERSLSYSIDAYDFDDGMKHDIKDMELTGRGISRVRYVPYLSKEQGVQLSGKEPDEKVEYEEVVCEHVPWKHFRHGPARVWQDVPWVAFELFLTREELTKLAPKLGGKIELDTTLAGADKNKSTGENIQEVFKRARVWEIWDKNSRKVLFIAPSYKEEPLKEVDDPLDLLNFFPTPKPLYAIETSDNLIPVIPYEIYRDQAEELERVSRRIMALIESIKSRGVYNGMVEEIEKLANAEDNTLVPLQNPMQMANGAKLEDALAWWPIEPAVKALAQLVEHRQQIKEVIYEITGISDILRGENQASETATATNVKQQWGSLRIQTKQGNIARYARDLFRLKAEIVTAKFSWQTITLMTGLSYPTKAEQEQAQAAVQQAQQQAPPQPGQPPQQPQIPPQIQDILSKPSREDVEQLLRNDATRNFRVDVESDSTIRADMTRNQQNMTEFLQGTAQFAQGMGPIVMTFKEMVPAVLEVYSAFARNFKLGKQAEDALDSVADKARQMANQPPPPPQTPPEVQIKQAELQMKAQESQQKMAADKQAQDQQLQFEAQKFQQEMAFEQQKHQADMAMRGQDLQMRQAEAQQAAQLKREEMAANQQNAAQDRQANQQQFEMNYGLERDKMVSEAGNQELNRQSTAAEGDKTRQAQAQEGDKSRKHDMAKVEAPAKAEAKKNEPLVNELKELRAALEAPAEIVRGPDGRASAVRRGKRTMSVVRDKDGKAVSLQ